MELRQRAGVATGRRIPPMHHPRSVPHPGALTIHCARRDVDYVYEDLVALAIAGPIEPHVVLARSRAALILDFRALRFTVAEFLRPVERTKRP